MIISSFVGVVGQASALSAPGGSSPYLNFNPAYVAPVSEIISYSRGLWIFIAVMFNFRPDCWT